MYLRIQDSFQRMNVLINKTNPYIIISRLSRYTTSTYMSLPSVSSRHENAAPSALEHFSSNIPTFNSVIETPCTYKIQYW